MRRFAGWVVLSVSALLASCGGSGGGNSSEPNPMQTGEISGVAFDAELIGATVTVSTYNNTEQFGQSVTDGGGRFAVSVATDTDQVLKISTAGGYYVDEYTGENRQELFGFTRGALRMYLNYTPGSSLQIAPTIYTTLASNLADYLMEQGVDARDAVTRANAALSEVVGADIETTIPHNVTMTPDAGVSAASIQYGFTSAAISALMHFQENVAPYASSIDFTEYASRDIRDDGVLNESASNGWTFEGGYRHALAVSMLQMAASDRNATGLSLSSVLDFAESLNSSASELFGDDGSVPLDAEKPIISNVLWNGSITATNNPLIGAASLTFGVGDVFGIQSLRVLIDDREFADLSGMNSPSVEIDTTQLPDGDHYVKIIATNVLGYSSEDEQKINTANYSTSISNVSIEEGKTYRDRISVHSEVHDQAGIVLVEYFIDTQRIIGFDDGDVGVYEWNLYTPAYADGGHTFRIVATNGVGIKTERSFQFVIDNTAPEVGVWLAENAYIEGSAQILVTYEAGADVQLSMGEAPISSRSSGKEGDIDWTIFEADTNSLADGQHQISVTATDAVGNIVTKAQSVIVDNTAPSVRITYPQNSGRIGGQFHMSWIASDANGFGENPFEILIDGNHHSWVSNWEITNTVNPAIYGPGLHTVSLRVIDASGKASTAMQYVYFDI